MNEANLGASQASFSVLFGPIPHYLGSWRERRFYENITLNNFKKIINSFKNIYPRYSRHWHSAFVELLPNCFKMDLPM